MIDMNRALKTASTTGDVRFGLAETRKAMKKGEAKMIVVAENCPDAPAAPAGTNLRIVVYKGTNIELGNACGKPFPISALAVVSPGESNILSA
jgi:large subunit ribosomal protein L30e